VKTKIVSAWTVGVEEPEEMEALVKESWRVLERLESMIDRKQETSVSEMKKTSNFTDTQWTYKMANELGYQRALDEIKNIIRIKTDDRTV